MSATTNYTAKQTQLLKLLKKLLASQPVTRLQLARLQKKYPKADGNLFSKTEIITGYKKLTDQGDLPEYDAQFVRQIRMKPVRTISGVTPVTVLTKPFPCPGNCIFCPNDIRMPKSYLADEPGAQRAERNWFDPYLQVFNRLQAFKSMGHSIDKVELIILGGTWSFYPLAYQRWFITQCVKALNQFDQPLARSQVQELTKKYQQLSKQLGRSNDPQQNQQLFQARQLKGSKLKQNYNQVIQQCYLAPEKKLGVNQWQTASWAELEKQQQLNETAKLRCVGLVLETRPDYLDQKQVINLRRLGATKIQLGVQSLVDKVLQLNHRGHNVTQTAQAFRLLRQAGFKIHAHWMANLYGSNVKKDQQDYLKLFNDHRFKPDELKIYPCSLLETAELMQYYQQGKWQPYTYDELLAVVSFCLQYTPGYCRLTRVIRDISSADIVAGNKKTNFRQIAQQYLAKKGQQSQDIRAREIRGQSWQSAKVKLKQLKYQTSTTKEIFLQFVTENNKLLAFLRLSLPQETSFMPELKNSAVIREIHVYGPAVSLGKKGHGKVQHSGFGTQLIKQAKKIATAQGYQRLAVISAMGTREYYRKKGFSDGKLYQSLSLSD
ncbi:MAG: tRNA uridine(34) 5-carboxymethylaminomethyl modification radical SAM/GNAT enzyme Elp3 [Candidatus Pacebacteria bacterium]|nr:tRNA uridine(34) 5-carboxymethylaminomethyl modification radical SAM/GNAT enzyme Elp3 [Candidatus Paceibacterota bacterium]